MIFKGVKVKVPYTNDDVDRYGRGSVYAEELVDNDKDINLTDLNPRTLDEIDEEFKKY